MASAVAAVVAAAGRGTRAGGELPKQYRHLGTEPVIRSSLSLLAWHGEVGAVQPVIHPDDSRPYEAAAQGLKLMPPVFGGATRQASVRAGLEALSERMPDIVLIHDAARPFASPDLVSHAIAAAERSGAAIPALPVTDTVKTVDAAGMVDKTLDRGSLRLVQTPQSFAYPALLDAHRRVGGHGRLVRRPLHLVGVNHRVVFQSQRHVLVQENSLARIDLCRIPFQFPEFLAGVVKTGEAEFVQSLITT